MYCAQRLPQEPEKVIIQFPVDVSMMKLKKSVNKIILNGTPADPKLVDDGISGGELLSYGISVKCFDCLHKFPAPHELRGHYYHLCCNRHQSTPFINHFGIELCEDKDYYLFFADRFATHLADLPDDMKKIGDVDSYTEGFVRKYGKAILYCRS